MIVFELADFIALHVWTVNWIRRFVLDLRYGTIEEFNVDCKAECGQLNLTHVTRNNKYKKKKLKQTNTSAHIVLYRFKLL